MRRARAVVRLLMLLLSCAVLAPVAAPAAATPPVRSGPPSSDRLDAFVSAQMKRADVPGTAYAVVGPHGIEHQRAFGIDGDGEPVTSSTPFLWGSVAKPVTASLVVKLAGEALLDLDAPVTRYLPRFTMADGSARAITVRQLLSQTSGIPERLDLTDRYDAHRRPSDVVAELKDVHLAGPVGGAHHYSSINYVLLAAIVESATGQSYTDVLRRRLLASAGMETAVTSADPAFARIPPGHRYVFGRTRPFRTGFASAEVASGYLGGSLKDLVAFARANLSTSTVLTDDQRARLFAPEVATGERRSYGLGWRTWQVMGGREPMVWHAGAVPGFQTAIVLLPSRDRAIVVLQNAYGSFQESQLLDTSWGLASLLSGAQPQPHGVEPLYAVLLVTLSGTCLGLASALLGSLRRLRRPPARGSRRRAIRGLILWATSGLLLVGGLLALPVLFGVTGRQAWLWAPDVTALLYAAVALIVVVTSCRVAAALHTLRSRP